MLFGLELSTRCCAKLCEQSGYEDVALTTRTDSPTLPPPQKPDKTPNKKEEEMRKAAVRRRRATGPVSPVMGLYCSRPVNGLITWEAWDALGEMAGKETVLFGTIDESLAVERLATLIYGEDVESWSRRQGP